MGLLKLFSRQAPAPALKTPVSGSLAIGPDGRIIACTLPGTLPASTIKELGETVLHAFDSARQCNLPLSDLVTEFAGIKIVARKLRGGALIFLQPDSPATNLVTLPAMSRTNLEEFIHYLETYIECWKQFNYYVNLARAGNYTNADEGQFLEVKSLITQGLEAVLAAVEQGAPRKDEVMTLVTGAPSIRYLAEHENSIATVEAQWHKAYLTMQSLLGRLKVQQQKQDGEWSWGSLFK